MKIYKFLTRFFIIVCVTFLLATCGDNNGPPSDDASIADIQISVGQLDQIFQSDMYSYTASVGFLASSISITPTTTNAYASIDIIGDVISSNTSTLAIPLTEGVNTITILVTAQDGVTTQTYTIDVTRISPTILAQQAYLKASNAEAWDAFGNSIAIDGNTLVIAAIRESSSANGGELDNSAQIAGAVYVFVRNGTTWTQQAYLKASNAEAGDFFGGSVDISGDTLVVGASWEGGSATGNGSDNSNLASGAVYVFTRSGTTWTQQAYLKASNAGFNDFFGSDVAIDGDTLVVGARSEKSGTITNENDNSVSQAGAAYIFTRSDATWSQQAYLKASDVRISDRFGYSVDISSDTVVVGATGYGGSAYIFTRSGTNWTPQSKLTAENAEYGDDFGASVSIYGNTLAVGAIDEDPNDNSDDPYFTESGEGAVYVFTRVGSTWTQHAHLKASNLDIGDNFGNSVALEGNTLAVGALYEDSSLIGGESDNTATDAGAVYVFTRIGTTWSEQQQIILKANNADAKDVFGASVAIDGGILAIGAYGERSNVIGDETNNSSEWAGAVYIWE